MSFKQIGTPNPKYLAATDILIGDMSDLNYEFLLFGRPVILLANTWLRENFSDIGIKADLAGLEDAIRRSIDNPDEYKEQREYWLKRTMHKPDGFSSKRCIDVILERAGIDKPKFVFLYGSDPVQKAQLEPLLTEAKRRGLRTNFIARLKEDAHGQNDTIYVAAHVENLNISGGYKVHFDHGLKGKGTANVETQVKYYEENAYFPLINLHITAGEAGQERTEMLLGPNSDRAMLVGYPKADVFIKFNTKQNKIAVCRKLGFEPDKPLITYVPAGEESYIKPGGSLSQEVIDKLKEMAFKNDYNILVKLKYPKPPFVIRCLKELKRILTA